MNNAFKDIVIEDYEHTTFSKVKVGDRFINRPGQWFQIMSLDRTDRSMVVRALTERCEGYGAGTCQKKDEDRHIKNTAQWLIKALRYKGEE